MGVKKGHWPFYMRENWKHVAKDHTWWVLYWGTAISVVVEPQIENLRLLAWVVVQSPWMPSSELLPPLLIQCKPNARRTSRGASSLKSRICQAALTKFWRPMVVFSRRSLLAQSRRASIIPPRKCLQKPWAGVLINSETGRIFPGIRKMWPNRHKLSKEKRKLPQSYPRAQIMTISRGKKAPWCLTREYLARYRSYAAKFYDIPWCFAHLLFWDKEARTTIIGDIATSKSPYVT